MTSTNPDYGGRDWRNYAACRCFDTELFFPIQDSDDEAPALTEQIRKAKAVCAACPVRQRCLDEALRRMPYGIAGGLTALERQRLHPDVRPEFEGRLRRRTGSTTRAENRQAGINALRAGHSVDEVAEHCQVSHRTVCRWLRAQPKAEGSAAATATPLQISRSNALLRTRITEGQRV
ncbi:WhiB family transcriptional regulator [Pseudonocardia sp. 73-21]|uniref:WhiB family transcriptional regulator n=1 Tax=Pseudonocardia sp. 73-21 TaxID=1895809 RepID=UPI000968A51F|nr:MAG: hypothetical protein BGP03_10325 [Pseudonocardia sp. 73-21]